MKKTILLSCMFTLASLGLQQAFASTGSQEGKNQESNQEKQSGVEKSDGIDVDSTTLYSPIITDSESPEQERRIAPAEVTPMQRETTKPEPPAEDQSNTAVSSFNFFYYLIEKVKFPDLLDESF